MNIKAGDVIVSELRKDRGFVINKTNWSITIKWRQSTERIVFESIPWDWSNYDYKKEE